MLRSPAMAGFVTDRVKPTQENGGGRQTVRKVVGPDGLYLRPYEPVVSEAEYEALQQAMDARAVTRRTARNDANPLSGIVRCGVCGMGMYRVFGRRPYYRCASHGLGKDRRCPNGSVRMDELMARIHEAFLETVGNAVRTERRFVRGQNHAPRIAELTNALSIMRDDREAGLYADARGLAEFRERAARYEAERAALEATPATDDHYEAVPMGETWAEHFADLDDDARGALLRAAGVEAVFRWAEHEGKRHPVLGIALPPDMSERLG